MNHKFLSFGERAVVVEFTGLAEALAGFELLKIARLTGVIQLVPGARTVLVQFDPSMVSADRLKAALGSTLSGESPAASSATSSISAPPADSLPPIELAVCYDGPDLESLATQLGRSPEALIAEHLAADWRVGFAGFTPGFTYLWAPDWHHRIERLASPRTRIEPGSLGLAAEFCGVYPRATPGGWQLIGSCDALLWDITREPAALLAQPGQPVKFRRVS